MSKSGWAAIFIALVVLSRAGEACADVRRFAVIVGNDVGRASDGRLRYAETDAARVARVLREVGDFLPSDIVVLAGEPAESFRSTLITVNDRIRSAAAIPDTQTLLLVYYSGHADAQGLHLGATDFAHRELGELVRGSPATFRLLVVDACRSGALTRVKGGRTVLPFALPSQPLLSGEGMAFLTASAVNEDAQESDEIQGSFFTHAWLSGLLGPADADGDGAVMLDESYRYAYGATLRATSRSFAGTQHATFRYDFRGHGAIPMARLARKGRSVLVLPRGASYLVLRGHREGQVAGEVGVPDAARALSLLPGTYFLRGRGPDVLLEGSVVLRPGETLAVAEGGLERVEYARLVRKGGREGGVAHSLEAGPSVRSTLPSADTPCVGAMIGYKLELQNLGVGARLGACQASLDNDVIHATPREYSLDVSVLRSWDLEVVTLTAGLGAGATLTEQTFETRGVARDRSSLAPYGAVITAASVDVTPRVFAGLTLAAQGHLLRTQGAVPARPEWQPVLGARGAVTAGVRF